MHVFHLLPVAASGAGLVLLAEAISAKFVVAAVRAAVGAYARVRHFSLVSTGISGAPGL
jgi:hypothetical protein